ncbi:hypothetical protein GCM10022214_18950 [Actinomadura miaoliensis]|uniref:Uncharacterized protein n=1 Tax=Actinomadura miaoliensis TaxID=430685 RepID=A0ABP7VEF6_9ACTN
MPHAWVTSCLVKRQPTVSLSAALGPGLMHWLSLAAVKPCAVLALVAQPPRPVALV